MLSLDTVTHTEFEAHLQEIFRLVLSDGFFPLQLVAVRLSPSSAPGAKRASFSLTFRAEREIRLPQGIRRLENDRLGPMEVFLVQVSPTEAEVVFG